ncbi:amidohydrolase family protein [Rickettsiales bacterium LUAb2]
MPKIIDTHVHFWDINNNINTWIDGQSAEVIKTIKHNFLPENYLANTNNEIAGIVHVQAHDDLTHTTKELQWLEEVSAKNPNLPINYIAFIDMTQNPESFNNELKKIMQYKKVVGVRHILSHKADAGYSPNDTDVTKNPNIAINLKSLANNNLMFDCQAYPYQILQMLPAISDTKILTVIEHLALPSFNNQNDKKVWQDCIKVAAEIPHVNMKLSGLDMFGLINEVKPIVSDTINAFGTSRSVYGSNHPVCCTNNQDKWTNALLSLGLNKQEEEQIFFSNAKKIYNF